MQPILQSLIILTFRKRILNLTTITNPITFPNYSSQSSTNYLQFIFLIFYKFLFLFILIVDTITIITQLCDFMRLCWHITQTLFFYIYIDICTSDNMRITDIANVISIVPEGCLTCICAVVVDVVCIGCWIS